MKRTILIVLFILLSMVSCQQTSNSLSNTSETSADLSKNTEEVADIDDIPEKAVDATDSAVQTTEVTPSESEATDEFIFADDTSFYTNLSLIRDQYYSSYFDFLKSEAEQKNPDTWGYNLCFIDHDNIPELLIADKNDYYHTEVRIYRYQEEKIKLSAQLGSYASLDYIPHSNKIYALTQSGERNPDPAFAEYGDIYGFYKLDGSVYQQIGCSVFGNRSYFDDEERIWLYYDGLTYKTITDQEQGTEKEIGFSQARQEEYEYRKSNNMPNYSRFITWIEGGCRTFSEETFPDVFNEYFPVQEKINLTDVLTEYRDYLQAYINLQQINIGNIYFQLAYLDTDNIPELIVVQNFEDTDNPACYIWIHTYTENGFTTILENESCDKLQLYYIPFGNEMFIVKRNTDGNPEIDLLHINNSDKLSRVKYTFHDKNGESTIYRYLSDGKMLFADMSSLIEEFDNRMHIELNPFAYPITENNLTSQFK